MVLIFNLNSVNEQKEASLVVLHRSNIGRLMVKNGDLDLVIEHIPYGLRVSKVGGDAVKIYGSLHFSLGF